MGSFGERLRREREMRGISLDEIATATKISARNLRALEEEKFNQLPGGIFNKGFVRAYAKFLGIDEEHIVAEYVAASQDTESTREQKLKVEFARPDYKKEAEQEISLEPKSQWGTIAAIVLVAVLAFGGYQVYQKKKAERQQQQLQHPSQPAAVATPKPVTPAPAVESKPAGAADTGQPTTSPSSAAPNTSPAAQPPTSGDKNQPTTPAIQKSPTDAQTPKPPSGQTAAADSPIQLNLKVNKQSWVSIKADGKLIISENLAAGTERAIKASEKVEMVLGNSGGVELTFNGKPVENLAKGQDVRRITFTPSGYE